ncbi:glyoxalase/bleomycin resistance protein/dioxygenase [mine drainage metagenome]|uniref:Glyoxalase/bleomycin resistance protein/dioxygenase n=1 Tax=mine drainage metagenome TaxID=410659 RepID=T0ZAC7_9ZZZZ
MHCNDDYTGNMEDKAARKPNLIVLLADDHCDVAFSSAITDHVLRGASKHFAHAKAEGAKIVSEPEDGFWGGRIYRVLDHEGHQWEISQRGRDLAADRWQLPPGVTRGLRK